MSNVCIDVDFLGGTDVSNAVKEAKDLAIKLNIAYVCFSFNGTKMSIGQNADVDKAVTQFQEQKEGFIVES